MVSKKYGKGSGIKYLIVLPFMVVCLFMFSHSALAATLGDINSDGVINVKDVAMVQKHVILIPPGLNAAEQILADVNGNGVLNVIDVSLIMRFAIGKISTFPPVPTVTSLAFTTATTNDIVTITLTGGTFKAGPIVAADFTFAGGNAAALAAGTFTRTSNTVVTITGLTLAAATNNTVTVKEATMATRASSVAAVASTVPTVTSPAFPTVAGNNRVTIALAGGTFKTGAITAADFIFAGSNAAVLANGTFTRISDMVVSVTTSTPLVADTSNTVSVKATAMAIQASSVAAAASTISPVTSVAFETATGNNRVLVSLVGGTFRAGPITALDFTFTGGIAAALAVGNFTRLSDTEVAITVPAALAAVPNNTVTVKATAMAIQASSVTAAAGTIDDLPPEEFTTVPGNNTVTITLTNGTFRSGLISSSDFNFTDGPNTALLAVGTFSRISDTVVIVTVPTPLAAATDNEVVVRARAMATEASLATATASTRLAITSPAYNTAATNTKITITLTGGTFKEGPIVAGDFTFAGANATALAAGTFTRSSDTVVTVNIAGPLVAATNNTVTVKAVTMATQASLVTVLPSD